MKQAQRNPIVALTGFWQQLHNLDLADINFSAAGSWPVAGKISVWLMTAVLTLGSGYLFYLSPRLQELKQAETEEQTLLTRYSAKAVQAAGEQSYQQQLNSLVRLNQSADRQLPAEQSVPELVETITDLAQRHQIEMSGIKLLPLQYSLNYTGQPARLNISGSYADIVGFVSGLSQTERLIGLHDFVLKTGSGSLELSLDITAYYRPAAATGIRFSGGEGQ